MILNYIKLFILEISKIQMKQVLYGIGISALVLPALLGCNSSNYDTCTKTKHMIHKIENSLLIEKDPRKEIKCQINNLNLRSLKKLKLKQLKYCEY